MKFLSKIPMAYITKLEQIVQIFVWNHKKIPKSSVLLGKKNKVGGITLPKCDVKGHTTRP